MRWLVADVAETIAETANAVTLRLDVPDWPGHRAGQHVDVRLTAEDGYSTQRSYSIASAPGTYRLELTVIRLDDGEVSPYLTTAVEVGDQLELRGPIGGYFVWDPADSRPVLLIGGGSGVVPLMCMLRQHAQLDHQAPIQLIYSARTQGDLLYRAELNQLTNDSRSTIVTLTREPASDWTGRRGRVDRELLSRPDWAPQDSTECFVCGPTPFVETVASQLTTIGHDPSRIKTERFGPTGGD